jgi:hypothetical protein
MAAGYGGNEYVLANLNPFTWADEADGDSLINSELRDADGAWRRGFSAANLQIIVAKADEDPSLRSRVRPGDIVYYGSEVFAHVMIVNRVTYESDGSVDPENIHLIEATYGSVTNRRQLDRDIARVDIDWVIGRLR